MPNEKIPFELDKLFDSIEKMIDTQDDIWHEEQLENYRAVQILKDDVYRPTKAEAKRAFETAVKEIVKEMFRNRSNHLL
jgi:hypothetical protein